MLRWAERLRSLNRAIFVGVVVEVAAHLGIHKLHDGASVEAIMTSNSWGRQEFAAAFNICSKLRVNRHGLLPHCAAWTEQRPDTIHNHALSPDSELVLELPPEVGEDANVYTGKLRAVRNTDQEQRRPILTNSSDMPRVCGAASMTEESMKAQAASARTCADVRLEILVNRYWLLFKRRDHVHNPDLIKDGEDDWGDDLHDHKQ